MPSDDMMGFSQLKTFILENRIQLVIGSGSVLDFDPASDSSAIVNAANEKCLGGGGVDGAISAAGGDKLSYARKLIPYIEENSTRCLTGDAKLTGPEKFGTIKTNHVIHAVGPNYNKYELDDYHKADHLLKSAYIRSLEISHSARIKEICFSLLCSGSYRGKRSQKDILEIAFYAIVEWSKVRSRSTTIDVIVLCCFKGSEYNQLCHLADEYAGKVFRLPEFND
jgi:O-acetyl-ADP-ribose deacetylase